MKKYEDIEDKPIMASEPMASYEVSRPHRVTKKRATVREHLIPPTISPNAHTPKEMHTILTERICRAEAGEEEVISHQVVFDTIGRKYGF